MNYLAEVLSCVEKVEIEQIHIKCPEVAAQVEKTKNNVMTFLENVYVRFSDRPRKNKILANNIYKLQEDIKTLLTDAGQITKKELAKSEHEMQSHVEALTKAKMALSLVGTLYTIHESLQDISTLNESKSYMACMERILETEGFINSLNFDENLPVLEEFNVVLCQEKSSLLNTLSNVFKDCVIIGRNILKIKTGDDTLRSALAALYFYKTSVTVLDHVTRFLWNNVFVSIVDSIVEIKIGSEHGFNILEVVVMDPNKRSSYNEVFANLVITLKFLSNNFDIKLAEDLSTLSYIGRDVRDNLSEIIIKHCLEDTIPSTQEGLQEYKCVIAATEKLEEALVSAKIFTEETTSILQYANNIDILFINKKCQDYLIQAQTLMKKDLHDLVEVGSVDGPEKSLEVKVDFSRCSVSKNVIEIISLLERILFEAISSSEMCAGRLFCTVRNICQKYKLFVPEYHKKFLQTIPQQIAVFYNNCMYISHNLTQWTDSYLRKLPSVLTININSFNDEGRQLREVASEMFTGYVEGQIKQIETIMKEANLDRQTLDNIDNATEKCLRQCLRQEELLKTVWHKVLPYAVYNRTLGAILNSLCNVVVNAIVKVEDISSDAAEQLLEMFKMVQTRGPKLFTDPKEVSLFVASWYRLNELLFVLSASLLDINDRWADGKGPLALQFKPEELKQLIRALFQNTERRAALLSKIHD